MPQPPWAWQEAMVAVLGRWHEAKAPAPAPPWLSPEELQRLGEQPAEYHGKLLELTRRRLAAFPFESMHAGWIAESLPADPLLRQWCVALMPPPLRERLVPLLPRGNRPLSGWRADPMGPPRWLAAWWRSELQTRFDYPTSFPWSVKAEQPLTWLARLAEGDLQTLLRRFGLRLVGAGVYRLPHAEVVQWLYRFPVELRDPLVAMVRERRFPELEAWAAPLLALAEKTAPVEVPVHLALLDIAAQAVTRGLQPEATRIAYRLSPDLGRELLAHLDASAGGGAVDLAALAAPAAVWDEWMRGDLDALVAAGKASPPDLSEEAA